MAVPQPSVPFVDVCAAIWNNTLFAYQSNAFQSLSLTPGSQWTTLTPGANVNASSCVVGQVDGKDALWVVGGAGADAMFPGYQQYLFEEAVWANPLPTASQFIGRIGHGVAWLNDSQSLLVYGGATTAQGSQFSSAQTFTISARSPYAVKSWGVPSGLPAAMDPLMFSWNSTSAGFVGGSTSNSQAWIFSPNSSWQLEAILSTVPGGYLSTQAALVTTADGTKTLQLFDFAAVPNNILNQVLQSASYGLEPGQANAAKGDDVLLTNLPTYNASLAPIVSRSGASLAQATSGLVAIVGGSDKSDPFVLFNQANNGWVDAQSFFAATSTSSTSSSSATSMTSSTSLPTSSATQTQPAFITSIPEPSESAAPNPSRGTILAQVIGGIVGGVVGAVLLLTLIFICFRSMYRKRQRRTAERNASPTIYDKDNKTMPPDPMTRPTWNISKPTLQPFNAGNKAAPPADTVVAAAVPRRAGKDQGWSSYFNASEAHAIADQANHRDSEISQSEYEGGSRITSTLPGLVGATRRDSNGLTMLADPSNATTSRGHRDEEDFLEHDSASNVDSWGPLGPSDGSSSWNRPVSTGDSNNIPLARIQNGAQRSVTTTNGMLSPGNERGLRTMMTREFAMPSVHLRPGIDRVRGTELSSLAPSSLDVETGSRATTSLRPGEVIMGRNGNSHVGVAPPAQAKTLQSGSADLSWLDLGQR